MTIYLLDINGTEPPIVGHQCQGLVAIEYSYAGNIVEPANVIFLKFEDLWYRLYFDCGIIFWRSDTTGPKGFVAKEISAVYRPINLADSFEIRNRSLMQISYEAIPGGCAVRLEFDGGHMITFRSVDDITTYA